MNLTFIESSNNILILETFLCSLDTSHPAVLFIFPFLFCSHIVDHPQEELAKFGYKSEKKVESFKIPSVW
jgi:hypothetical protein